MRIKVELLLLTAAIAVAISFLVRQRTMNELSAGNASIRQQLEARAMAPASEPVNEAPPANSALPLSQEERRELLRLRGQFVPLQRELADASNHLANLTRPIPQRAPKQSQPVPAEMSPAELGAAQEAAHQRAEAFVQAMQAFQRSERYTNASGFGRALGNYLAQNAGQLPDDLAKVESFGGPALPPGLSQRFELMRSGTVPEEAWAFTLVAREREPQQIANGSWQRIYLLANGSMTSLGTTAPPLDYNWTARERSYEEGARQHVLQRQGAMPRQTRNANGPS